MHHQGLALIDWLVVAGYFIAMAAIGYFFSKRQTSTDHYFAGGRSIPVWAVGMSTLATLISSVTFLAYPGEGYKANWGLLVQGLMVPVVLLGLVWIIVPLFRRVIGLSAYEYFERRFGYFARLYTSVEFSFNHFTKMGTVFYLLALALASMTGMNTYHVILIVGFCTIFYTWFGGIEAVVWTDVVQGFLFLVGGAVVVTILLFKPEGGPAAVVGLAWQNNKMSLGSMDWDFTHLTIAVVAANGLFYALQKYTTDQTIVQRFLLVDSDKKAIKAALMGPLLCVPTWMMFFFIGTCLWSFYQITGLQLPAEVLKKPEAVFPYFIMTQLPVGVIGLVLSALLAAAMSTLASDLNCLAAIGVEDFYRRFKPQCTDKQRLRMGKLIVCASGALAMAIAFLYVKAEGKSVLAIVFKLYAIFSGGIAGLFALAFFTTRANRQGVLAGILACVLFTAWAFLTSNSYTSGGEKRLFLDLGAWNYRHHELMLGVYSHLVLFGVGYVASLFFHTDPSRRELTIYGWLANRRALRASAAQKTPL
jgi:SSS family solute:Na+ symporter